MADDTKLDTDSSEGSDRPAKKKAKPAAVRAADPPAPVAPLARPSSGPPVFALAGGALLLGAVAGWFGRGAADEGAKNAPPSNKAAPTAVAASADVPAACTTWADAVCEGAGTGSEGCKSAKSAAKLLPGAACESAMPAVPETLGRLQAARGACTELVTKLCAELGEQSETCGMVKEKTQQFPTEQCQGMLEEFPQVLAELKKMEAQNAPVSAEIAAKQRAGDAPGFGPADAKVAVILYSDFECPFCSKAAATATALKEKYGDKIRFVFRQFPLNFHPNAKTAAEASLAANAQGKFWEFHDAMFENQRALDRASLEKYAEKAGLDVARFKKELDEGKWSAQVDADMKLAEDIGVSGTPTMLVGTKRVPNPTDPAAVMKLVDQELGS